MDIKGTDSIEVDATAEHVYRLLIDLSRIGEVSPSFSTAEWLDGATGPHAGARFVAHGGDRSDSTCRVLRAMPGEEWAFKANLEGDEPETWRYTFEHAGDRCVVTVTWDAPTSPSAVTTSLGNLKRAAEG